MPLLKSRVAVEGQGQMCGRSAIVDTSTMGVCQWIRRESGWGMVKLRCIGGGKGLDEVIGCVMKD